MIEKFEENVHRAAVRGDQARISSMLIGLAAPIVVTAALNISDQVVRFTQTGPVRVLADKVHDGVENPSAVAFGPHHELFLTSSAYFGSHPALQVIEQEPRRFK